MKTWHRQRGSVLTEATLAIPLFLGLLLGIADLAIAFSDRCAFLAAFHDATRKVSIEASACSDDTQLQQLIQTNFESNLHSFLPLRITQVNASISTANPASPQLQASLRTPVSCLFCMFFFSASGHRAEYSAAVTLPLEKRDLCS